MREFSELYGIAAARHGGDADLEARLITPLEEDQLRRVPDDRWLAMMAKSVFQAGFRWSLIEEKWPAFEAAFEGFDPARVGFYADDDLDRLLADRAIVRNGAKIQSVLENARFVSKIAETHGGFGAWIADWPGTDHHLLLDEIGKQGARLGGGTAQRFLRAIGRDTYVISPDVVARLIEEGVIGKAPTSRRAMAAVQDAFNHWSAQSGRPLCQVSQVLALSI